MAVRGADFLSTPLRGQVPVAVIHNPDNKASLGDAQSIMAWLAAAKTGKTELVPMLVDVNRLDATVPVRIAVVAGGLGAYFAKILDFAQRNNTLTITADLTCVTSGSCVLGVATEPNVEVIVSRQASAACGVDFVRAFRMMVKEY